MKKFIALVICIIMIFTLVSCGMNTKSQTSSKTRSEDSNIYSFMTEGDYAATYYIVDYDKNCVFSFYADESDDTCFVLPIDEGDLNSGLKGNISDGYSMIPFTMHYKEENKMDRVIMTFEDAYEIELIASDIDEALAIKEGKTIVDISAPEDSGKTEEGEVYTAEGQVCHRDRIVGKEDRIDAVIRDIEMGSGEVISYEKAITIEESLDVYSDSSKDIKNAYNNPDSPYRELMEALDEYLNHSVKWHGTVKRGAVATKEEAEKICSSEELVDMLGPSSWTSDEVIAQNYAKDKASGDASSLGIVYVLKENKSGVSITHLSRYGTSEREVLAPSGILYVVDSYEMVSVDSVDLLYVYVHEMEML